MEAIVNTRSNYKNCNFKKLKVVKFMGKMIALETPEFGFNLIGEPLGKMVITDFNIKEIISITE